ncbi:M56 family metallopeptidase [Pontibacter harenae]|uniref:M56 family metallopeptidase n=1 Tax=Pontibacter harenae TaxID=2894083 RepID=UPI001E4DA0A6|nr:M56 family metallopeptidase [Pontibacter harenae]MCC9167330.1 M48 family metalloprotease [Pontibacter harenae]
MNLAADFISQELVRALGWALLHSLWQGALVSLVLAVLLIMLNHHTANLRYKIAIIGMGAMLCLFLLTFVQLYSSAPAQDTAVSYASLQTAQPVFLAEASVSSKPLWNRTTTWFETYFEKHLPLLVSLWLMGLFVMMLRFLAGLAYIQRLRNYKVQELGAHWQETLANIQNRVGLSRPVKLAKSALVQVPMVVGHLKPLILIPLSATTALSQRQLEAILAHELAHIKRHDYLLNLLQQLAETLLFFHPAIWWMSGVVRAEREHCCDDLAVAACGDTLIYARALTQLAELRMPQAPAFAPAITGKKGSLLSRVKRLVTASETQPSFKEGFIAAMVIVVGLSMLSYGAWAGMKENNTTSNVKHKYTSATLFKFEQKEVASGAAQVASTLSITDSTGTTSDLIIIKNKKGEIAELYVNGRRIPKKDIPDFQKLIDERLQASRKAPRMKETERAATEEATREALASVNGRRQTFSYSYNTDSTDLGLIPPVPPVPPAPPLPPVPPLPVGLSDEGKKDMEAYEKKVKLYEQQIAEYEKVVRQHAQEVEAYQARSIPKAKEFERQRTESLRAHEESMRAHAQSIHAHEESLRRHNEANTLLNKIYTQLEKDVLVKQNAKEIDLKMTDEGFFIDGKKQPDNVYRKYQEMTKNKEGKQVNFTIKKSGTSQQFIIKD